MRYTIGDMPFSATLGLMITGTNGPLEFIQYGSEDGVCYFNTGLLEFSCKSILGGGQKRVAVFDAKAPRMDAHHADLCELLKAHNVEIYYRD